MCVCVYIQPPPWAAGRVSLELGTGALLLRALLLNGASCSLTPTPTPTRVRFQAVPWGNFDLERMRVTDLAASQG